MNPRFNSEIVRTMRNCGNRVYLEWTGFCSPRLLCLMQNYTIIDFHVSLASLATFKWTQSPWNCIYDPTFQDFGVVSSSGWSDVVTLLLIHSRDDVICIEGAGDITVADKYHINTCTSFANDVISWVYREMRFMQRHITLMKRLDRSIEILCRECNSIGLCTHLNVTGVASETRLYHTWVTWLPNIN